jgi:phosphoglycolate phosphatase-like HAD superfamily hydrolase
LRRVLLFDIDGTLLLTGGAGRRAIQIAMREAFGIAEAADVPIHGSTDRGIARDLFQAHDLVDDAPAWERFRDAYLVQLRSILTTCDPTALAGVPALLERLVDREGYGLGLLTGNVRQGARLKLDRYELTHFFDRHQAEIWGGFGDEHPERNDVARAAHAGLCRQFGHSDCDDRVWVIGDTPNDIRCARAIGARVIAVATGATPLEELARLRPDAALPSLSDADAILRLLDSDVRA